MKPSRNMQMRNQQGKPPSIDVSDAVRIVKANSTKPLTKEELDASVDDTIIAAYRDGHIIPIVKSMKKKSARWMSLTPSVSSKKEKESKDCKVIAKKVEDHPCIRKPTRPCKVVTGLIYKSSEKN